MQPCQPLSKLLSRLVMSDLGSWLLDCKRLRTHTGQYRFEKMIDSTLRREKQSVELSG
ncbi:MAG: hypothetical protein KAX39_04375 [candidate division Zixibacteria bacterium]|nr:hypothetical protein [candidate division Zixibacteria bacterium]